MLSRRLIPLTALSLALALPAPAAAIVNGDPASDGDYPAHGFLGVDSDGNGFVNSFCSGTLVGSRQFLTAARCTTNVLGQARQPTRFTVRIGDVALPGATIVQNVASNDIPDATEIEGGYVRPTGRNDVAVLTLTAPVDADPVRVLDSTETSAWSPGTVGRVLGWGEIEGGDPSDVLLGGDVVVRADAACPNPGFDPEVMLCAAGTPAEGDENPCPSDSGSPLLVPDGALDALAGVFSGEACATAATPGVFARVGSEPLNGWVHERIPTADFDLSHQPRVAEAVTLTSTSRHPEGDGYFTTFRWDLDNNGTFGDKVGKSISTSYGQVGEAVAGLEASRPGGDRAVVYYAFDVEPNPNLQPPATPVAPTTPPTSGTNPGATSGPLATILSARRPKVRRGRFALRVRFADAAPAGTAVLEVYRGTRRIGIARTKVAPGATKRVRVKLTPQGRRLLRRADSRRLRIRVRVRVGRQILRTKRVTIRR